MKKAIGIATSDWHFWHVAPVWRSNEKNWLQAMNRQLSQIIQAAIDNHCPILLGGDIFDHYNPIPETINFLMSSIPETVKIFAVPGQHDLEHHVLTMESLEKTGFEILRDNTIIAPLFNRQDGKLIDNCVSAWDDPGDWIIYFAPWGVNIADIQVDDSKPEKIKILLAHKYVWFDENTRYGGADIPEGKLTGLKNVLQKFDFAIFGDNHIPFRKKIGKCQVINPGTLVKRKIDEKDYKTGYTVLFDDKSIEFHEFDTSEDVYLEIQVTEQSGLNISSREFMDQLRAMEGEEIDYRTEIEKKLQEMNRPDMEKQFTEIFDKYGA